MLSCSNHLASLSGDTTLRVLVIGGSGYVGKLILPMLAEQHEVRVFDLAPPPLGPWKYSAGDVVDLHELEIVSKDTDALVFMAMGSTDDDGTFKSNAATRSAFDVSVKGLYFALDAARKAGLRHAVYTSSMSIYDGPTTERYTQSEDIAADARDVYGLTKSLGEEVCRFAVRSWQMSVNVLRLCLPVSMEQWNANDADLSVITTSADDVGRALLAALNYRNGYQDFMISGDRDYTCMDLSKAKRLLHWEPSARPTTLRQVRPTTESLARLLSRAKRLRFR